MPPPLSGVLLVSRDRSTRWRYVERFSKRPRAGVATSREGGDDGSRSRRTRLYHSGSPIAWFNLLRALPHGGGVDDHDARRSSGRHGGGHPVVCAVTSIARGRQRRSDIGGLLRGPHVPRLPPPRLLAPGAHLACPLSTPAGAPVRSGHGPDRRGSLARAVANCACSAGARGANLAIAVGFVRGWLDYAAAPQPCHAG